MFMTESTTYLSHKSEQECNRLARSSFLEYLKYFIKKKTQVLTCALKKKMRGIFDRLSITE